MASPAPDRPDPEALSAKLGFDVPAALEKYTFENPTYPGITEERLFECWRCSRLCSSWKFTGLYGQRGPYAPAESTSVYAVLERMVLGNNMSACERCTREMVERPTRRPRLRQSIEGATARSFSERRWNRDGPYRGRWMFEVQVKVNGHPIGSTTFRHVGYSKQLYTTKQAAADAYKAANPHMRTIRKESKWCSDWDPETGLRFAIRKVENVERTIEVPWDAALSTPSGSGDDAAPAPAPAPAP